ncbi:6-phosphogluconolactonase [Phototrophicus methaneseepsis]|uniref:6-phosphogluconolactonase n=1 Tax=Phototrophicus methaneseepsis TaxID=2710758 RepID=A0A7S8ICC3_9CHLR|nr:6-phosphogluconolactonase [Phototrophicus methaneseepsis]QPC81390.1 6-phosphogluconolactonase [Phototrophicus methaneseepsis]
MRILRVSNKNSLIEFAATRLAKIIIATLEHNDTFSLVLSGGSTPKPIYERLAQPDLAEHINWSKVYIFFGDERTVPPDHADSNYRMANEALFQHVPLPAANIYRMHGEDEPHQAASDYEAAIRDYMGETQPGFDMVLLGMGDDGHTASLFPGTAALHEHDKWVMANEVPQHHTWRLTMTVPLLNISENIMFLVAGSSKTDTLKAVLEGPKQPDVYPSQLIHPENEMVTWLVDAEAGAILTHVDKDI